MNNLFSESALNWEKAYASEGNADLENGRRVKLCMESLLAANEICFAKTPEDLSVTFYNVLNRNAGGKVLLLQHFVYYQVGELPEIVRFHPRELRFAFSLGEIDDDMKKEVSTLLNSLEGHKVRQSLGIYQVHFHNG